MTTPLSIPPSPWSHFPLVQHPAALLSPAHALSTLQTLPETLLIVDVRRNDYQGGAIRGSINLPAESFWYNRAELYGLCRRAGVRMVAFYCGSSSGRGPRCAGWFNDYLVSVQDTSIQALTLEGGIKGWVKAGEAYLACMKNYEPEHWGGAGGAGAKVFHSKLQEDVMADVGEVEEMRGGTPII